MAALLLGLVLLCFSLVPAFKSFLHPLTILVAIPLGIIGAGWAMPITGKHACMPSFMGMILLAGIVVKNSILLIDFILEARERGESRREALIGSVRVRTPPILMTAVAAALGRGHANCARSQAHMAMQAGVKAEEVLDAVRIARHLSAAGVLDAASGRLEDSAS